MIPTNHFTIKRGKAAGSGGEAAAHWIGTAEQQFHFMMQCVKDYAILFTDAEGNIVTWNAGCERILGYSEAEAIGMNVQVIFTPEDRKAGIPQKELNQAKKTGRAEDERWHLRKDGERFFASGIFTALRDEDGELHGYCKILRDLTERKNWEDKLRQDYEKQSHIAQTLQQSLLAVPPPNTFPGLTIKTIYEAAYDDSLIGGDFVDVFAVAENKVALIVGDVTGKGLEAATYTAEVKYALRAFLREYANPATAMVRLNKFVLAAERLDRAHLGTTYVAVACAVADTLTGEIICSSAGMESPFVLSADTKKVTELTAGGPLLGVNDDAAYDAQTYTLQEGDIFVITTDGVTEARSSGRRFFGYEGLLQAVQETSAVLPALSAVGEAVIQRVKTFAGRKLQDDVCLLMARRCNAAGGSAAEECSPSSFGISSGRVRSS